MVREGYFLADPTAKPNGRIPSDPTVSRAISLFRKGGKQGGGKHGSDKQGNKRGGKRGSKKVNKKRGKMK